MQIDGPATFPARVTLDQPQNTSSMMAGRAAPSATLGGEPVNTARTAEFALFGVNIEKALKSARGPEVAQAFSEEFLKGAQTNEAPQTSARNAISQLEAKGTISPQEAQALNAMVNRLEELPPKEKQAQAMSELKSLMEESDASPSYLRQLLDQGSETAASGSSSSPTGNTEKAAGTGKAAAGGGPASPKGPSVFINAPAGFLWKPNSGSTGKLAILLPPGMSGRVSSLRVVSPTGGLIENGKGAGVGNGGREHFRFSKPGQDFPPGSKVEITLKTGQTVSYTIPNPSIRNEGRS